MAVGLRCGSTTIKYLLFFFNFLFTLCGLAIVILGGLVLSTNVKNGNGLNNAIIFLIAVGAFIFVVAFFGCCGAVRESHFMLVTFACLLMTIIVLEIIAAILTFVAVGSVNDTVAKIFDEIQSNRADQSVMDFIDGVQINFKCCGSTGPDFWGKTSDKIPKSCCGESGGGTGCAKAYMKGCQDLLTDSLKQYGKVIGAVAIAIAVIEVIGVWFALALAGEIKKLSR